MEKSGTQTILDALERAYERFPEIGGRAPTPSSR
ncbi:DUF5953 family protein [Pyxidicoccus xibeiensis]